MIVTTTLSSSSGYSIAMHSARLTALLSWRSASQRFFHEVAREEQRDRRERALRERVGLANLPTDLFRAARVLDRDVQRTQYALCDDATACVPWIRLAPVATEGDQHAQ